MNQSSVTFMTAISMSKSTLCILTYLYCLLMIIYSQITQANTQHNLILMDHLSFFLCLFKTIITFTMYSNDCIPFKNKQNSSSKHKK